MKQTITAEKFSHLVFLSSEVSESLLLMIIPENPPGMQIQIVKTFPNMAPLNDFSIFRGAKNKARSSPELFSFLTVYSLFQPAGPSIPINSQGL